MQTPAQSQYALFHPKFVTAGLNSAKSWAPTKSTMAAPPGSPSLPFTGANLAIVLTVAVLLVAAAVLLRVRVHGLGR
jgi:hypothetical protein